MHVLIIHKYILDTYDNMTTGSSEWLWHLALTLCEMDDWVTEMSPVYAQWEEEEKH